MFLVCWCVTSDLFANSFPHSGNETLSVCRSLKLLPYPVILRVQALSDRTPPARQGLHTIPTDLRTFFCSPAWSNSPVSKSNDDWIHPGSVEATNPSLA